MTSITNQDRAKRAQSALDTYTGHLDVLAPNEAAADLICDLLHYAVANEIEPESVIRTALNNFVGESIEPSDSLGNATITTTIEW